MICARSLRPGRHVTPSECTHTITGTADAADLETCRACPAGHELMLTAVIGRRHVGAQVPAYLRDTLAYVLPRHKRDKRFGVRFLALVAAQFGFTGKALDFGAACADAGLTVITRPLWGVEVDDALRKAAGKPLEAKHV